MKFLDLLERDPRLLERLDEELARVARGVAETGQAGDLTLKLRFVPHGDEMHISPKLQKKVPCAELRTLTVGLSTEGELMRDSEVRPFQQVLFVQRDGRAAAAGEHP